MADFYENNYAAYHEKTYLIDPAPWLEPLAARLKPGARILDVGCGSGRDMDWLNKRGYLVTGFEKSSGLAGLARENTGCEVIEGDFRVFDFTGMAMDAVIMAGSLVHLPYADLPAVFQNIISALANNPNSISAPLVYISLKEGQEMYTDSKGRTFYLWKDKTLRKIFFDCDFTVLDFRHGPSALGTDEQWLGYLLEQQMWSAFSLFYPCAV